MLNKIKNIFRNKSGREVADRLDDLGYFKYAEATEVEFLKNELANTYEDYGMLSTIYTLEKGMHYPKDYRLYSFNNDAIFTKGAFERFFTEIDPTLQKLNIPIQVNEEQESFSETKGLNHNITVNGTNYVIFNNFKDYNRGNIVAAKRLIEIINDVLTRNNINERVYPGGKGLYGQLVFLTNQQFNYISSTYPDTQRKPLKMTQWVRHNNANE